MTHSRPDPFDTIVGPSLQRRFLGPSFSKRSMYKIYTIPHESNGSPFPTSSINEEDPSALLFHSIHFAAPLITALILLFYTIEYLKRIWMAPLVYPSKGEPTESDSASFHNEVCR